MMYKLFSGFPATRLRTEPQGNTILKVMTTQTAEHERAKITTVDRVDIHSMARVSHDVVDLEFDLSVWLQGLECFCAIGERAFPVPPAQNGPERNFRPEFQITHAILIKCGKLIEELSRNVAISRVMAPETISDASQAIRTLVVSNNAFAQNTCLNFAEWNAWREIVSDRISSCRAFEHFDLELARSGLKFLPDDLRSLLSVSESSSEDKHDLEMVLPRLAGILRSLDIVRRMLSGDEPLKPALAIFAFINESIDELIFDINERLSVRSDEDGEFFGMLDAASYTLHIESRKVFAQELSSVIATRSATNVFARVESAFGLLNDNILQLLAGFVRLSESGRTAADVFPEFNEKLEQSYILRERLWAVLAAVRASESDPSEGNLTQLRGLLSEFLQSHISYLFYKDRETFERFCSEIELGPDGAEAGPVLHRFSAYVETLFTQVGMRTVLSNHPFVPE
jgi:hypothetical protein